jgi:hypothetical protein
MGWWKSFVSGNVPGLPDLVEDETLAAGALAKISFVQFKNLRREAVRRISVEIPICRLDQPVLHILSEVLLCEDVV